MTMQVQKDHAESAMEEHAVAYLKLLLSAANHDSPEIFSGTAVKLFLAMVKNARMLRDDEDKSAFDDDKLNYLSRTA